MLNLTLNELKLVAILRGIKGCKSMYKKSLLSTLSESESVFHSVKIVLMMKDLKRLGKILMNQEKDFQSLK